MSSSTSSFDSEEMLKRLLGNSDRAPERERMVTEQIQRRGVKDPRVLRAMRAIPRHAFIPGNLQSEAYEDHPVSIGEGQTISQPYIVAYMTELLEVKPGHSILEIGTGCGYQTAVLAILGAEVYTIEIIASLQQTARQTLHALGFENIDFYCGDGSSGWPQKRTFDRIIVTAAPPTIPQELVNQLAESGKMVIPVGEMQQDLTVMRRSNGRLSEEKVLPVRFVPITH
ncbi:MAG TPA: protein-L-isoaspartate(D-aspartate) O-methyltransferase [Leptospiraceae bacterium]|nr:protein-L-isoaspartate(D-aspartate) O-methyltransferase [Leptospirales bacterium]HMU82823.1 protein-L-isoaspartate(D-aspartate) O-methyltransferase [Leptospiraceae bacterium]HMW58549.1 protein-L-isoaspartate(D-aspartate) O-methyltransferase [Leptospiraceae bacterium]HMX55358.1 protein-L-isoaspartate(D-aspartate) O-methyltransferase [Leptospiraceae bacterium]HMZ35121.1 protein-L-isoaspartate(D-aspartate) O-methyltransferase [Leptospiraceae bacterium]